MTDREKAIVMAYTGTCMLTEDKFNIFHKYVEDLMGRPIYIHEMAYLSDEIKEKAKEDFIRLCKSERKPGHWEWDQKTGEYVCSECGCNPIYERATPDVSEIDKYRFCRWCGAKMEVDGNVTEF